MKRCYITCDILEYETHSIQMIESWSDGKHIFKWMKISNNGTKEISYDPAVMFTVTFITLTSSEMY